MTDEQPKEEEAKQETSTENNGNGSQPETTSLIKSANEAADRLKFENDRKEELIKKEEDLQARRALGGDSSGAGQENTPKEMSPQEYAKEVQEGLKTGKYK